MQDNNTLRLLTLANILERRMKGDEFAAISEDVGLPEYQVEALYWAFQEGRVSVFTGGDAWTRVVDTPDGQVEFHHDARRYSTDPDFLDALDAEPQKSSIMGDIFAVTGAVCTTLVVLGGMLWAGGLLSITAHL